MNSKIAALFLVFFVACFSYGQESTSASKNYTSLYTASITVNEGTQNWSRSLASVIFDETIAENDKVNEFYISKSEDNLLVNSEMPMQLGKDGKEVGSNNCSTLKKTCRSEKCVASTLIKILGDGDRNVLIKYERKMLSVQIYYTYQDCD